MQQATMNALDQVIQLNNEGVNLLSAGADRQAVMTLTRSLTFVQQLSEPKALPVPNNPAVPSNSLGSSESSDRFTNAGPFSCGERVTALPSQAPLVNLQDSCYFIYNKAVTISPDAQRDASSTPVFSACVIFNLALAYHRRGMNQKSQNKNANIEKAERLYEMICKLVQGSMSDDTAVFVGMVAINNLSYIHYQQRRYQQTKEELDWLSFIILQAGSKPSMLSNDDLTLLLLNVLLMTPPKCAGAA
jgi:hypothetical protein